MPRKRPARLRGSARPSRTTSTAGIPAFTAHALDRLERPELSAVEVARALGMWSEVVQKPVATLSAPHNDWTEFIGPAARSRLELAVQALNRRQAAPLRAELARLDAQFQAKTVNNPFADPSLPWWARRWWH